MVNSVSSSTGPSAYTKSSQLGGQAAQRRPETPVREAETATPVRETDKAERAQSNDNRTVKKPEGQLESRNDETTLRTEQARGSLLDLAV